MGPIRKRESQAKAAQAQAEAEQAAAKAKVAKEQDAAIAGPCRRTRRTASGPGGGRAEEAEAVPDWPPEC